MLHSPVAVVISNTAKIISNLQTCGKRLALQASKASIVFAGRVAISCFFCFSFQCIISGTVTVLPSTSCWYNSNKLSIPEEEASVTVYMGIKF